MNARAWWEGACYAPGLHHALLNIHRAERRVPTDADLPPVSVLPSTPASRAAMQLTRATDAYRQRKRDARARRRAPGGELA